MSLKPRQSTENRNLWKQTGGEKHIKDANEELLLGEEGCWNREKWLQVIKRKPWTQKGRTW